MSFYALWVNRHGQKHWDGPFDTSHRAWASLDIVTDKSGGWTRVARSDWLPAPDSTEESYADD